MERQGTQKIASDTTFDPSPLSAQVRAAGYQCVSADTLSQARPNSPYVKAAGYQCVSADAGCLVMAAVVGVAAASTRSLAPQGTRSSRW